MCVLGNLYLPTASSILQTTLVMDIHIDRGLRISRGQHKALTVQILCDLSILLSDNRSWPSHIILCLNIMDNQRKIYASLISHSLDISQQTSLVECLHQSWLGHN